MPRAGELSDFERGMIVGLHLGKKHTYQEIAAIVKRSKGAIQGDIWMKGSLRQHNGLAGQPN